MHLASIYVTCCKEVRTRLLEYLFPARLALFAVLSFDDLADILSL
jgi:hypothetical protein